MPSSLHTEKGPSAEKGGPFGPEEGRTQTPELTSNNNMQDPKLDLEDQERGATAAGNGDGVAAAADNEAREDDPEDESKYPGPLAMGIVMTAISMGMFLVSLDRTIVSTAIPSITDEFHSSGDIGWYASAYSLTGCALQLPLGRFYTFYPPKWVYLVLVGVFIVGSAVGAGAQSSNAVIVGRAIQGIGLGGLLSGSTILVAENAPLKRRPMFLGILIACMNVSAIIGPLVGGALTTSASWRWCFIINIPIGAVIMAVMFFGVKPVPGKDYARSWEDKIRHLDPLGAALLLPAIVCVMLALQWAGSSYAWGDWRIILLLVFGGVLAIAFVVTQILTPETATVPPHIAGQRTVVASFWFSTMTGGTMMVVTYWITIWFQVIQDVSAVQAGEKTIALVLSQSLGAILGGGGSQVIGYPSPIMMLSSIFAAVGGGMLSTMAIDAGPGEWIGYQVLVGLGLGMGTMQASLAVQTVMKAEDIPSAISLIFFGMQFGGALFVCVGQNVFNQQLIRLLTEAATTIPGFDPNSVLTTGATEIRSLVSNATDLAKILIAYNSALNSVFYVAAAIGGAGFFGAIFVQWKSTKGVEPMH